jgi:hypothetical protein
MEINRSGCDRRRFLWPVKLSLAASLAVAMTAAAAGATSSLNAAAPPSVQVCPSGFACPAPTVGDDDCALPLQLAQACIQPDCAPGTVPCNVRVGQGGCISWSCCQR